MTPIAYPHTSKQIAKRYKQIRFLYTTLNQHSLLKQVLNNLLGILNSLDYRSLKMKRERNHSPSLDVNEEFKSSEQGTIMTP